MKTFVLFGSTGDLATRYVLPALGTLLQKWVYDHLICVGRRDWIRDDFRNFLAPYPDLLNHTETISYVRQDIQGGDFSPLKNQIREIQGLDGDIIYHLCLSPEYFVTVVDWLASVWLNRWNARLMIEKPFWYDLESARALNTEIQKHFDEDRIYRVDHYLGKKYVRDLYDYRLNPSNQKWNDENIAQISIVAREMLTMEGRGDYYDKSWATRDFLQNHLLQILSIAIMDVSISHHYRNIQQSEYAALKSIRPLLLDPNHDVILWQYRWYREESWVSPNSRTETYIRVHLKLDSPWRETDIVLETWKALDRKESSVTILFRDGTEKVFAETPENKNNSYEMLIEKALLDDRIFFVPWENVEAAWQVVDDLLHCTDNCPILQIYEPGTAPKV